MTTSEYSPDDAHVEWAGALDLAQTASGFIPRRLPAWTRPQISDPAMDVVVQMPSGVRLRVCSTTTAVELDLQMTLLRQLPQPLRAAPFELVVDGEVVERQGVDIGHLISLGPAPGDITFDVGAPTTLRFDGLSPQVKVMEIWLPPSAIVECRAVRIDADASLVALPPVEGRRWIHHGSSISHCVGSVSPLATWPALVARAEGLTLTNLGFAGQCVLDPYVARSIGELDADLISLKLAVNVISGDVMRERSFGPQLHGFLDTIREGQPTTPVLVVSPISSLFREDFSGPVVFDAAGQSVGDDVSREDRKNKMTLQKMRATVEQIVTDRRAAGDSHLHFLDGRELFGPADGVDLPDGLHPNDAGNARIAERFRSHAFGARGPFAR
jgi:hypothetical protein